MQTFDEFGAEEANAAVLNPEADSNAERHARPRQTVCRTASAFSISWLPVSSLPILWALREPFWQIWRAASAWI
jgi:hypothetical protein